MGIIVESWNLVAFPRLLKVKMRIPNFCHYMHGYRGRQMFAEYQDQVPELEENLPDTKKALLRIRGTYTRSEIKKSVDMYTRDVYTVQH